MTLSIEIEINDEVAGHLRQHLEQIMKLPRVDAATGATIHERRYTIGLEIEQFAAETISANLNNALREDPTPAMLEHRRRIEASEAELRAQMAPTIRVKTVAPEKGGVTK